MEDDIGELTADILRVLRQRLSASEILRAHELLRYMENLDPSLAGADSATVSQRVRSALEDAIAYHLGEFEDLREATTLLAGISPKTRRSTMTRTEIKRLEAAAIPRSRNGQSDKVTVRRVEQIEQSIIAPAVRDALARSMRGSRPAQEKWRDCRVDYRLSGASEGTLLLRWGLQFESEQDVVLMAVCADGSAADGLCDRFPELTEVLVPSAGHEGRSMVQVSVLSHNGETEVPIHDALARDLSAELQKSILALDIADVYVARLPGQPGERRCIRITSTQEIALDEGFCYWTAPRHVQLDQVEIDYSGFPRADRYEFYLRPRLGVPTETVDRPSIRAFSLRVNEWISPGNGFELKWRPVK